MRNGIPALLLCVLTACDLSNPAEVREQASDLPVRGEWSATLSGVGGAPLSGSVSLREHAGAQIEATASISGGQPGRAYQWRIFRGSCAATAANQLALFATIQSYPDLTTDGTGAAGAQRLVVGVFLPNAAYSVRVRLATTQTGWDGMAPLACGDLQRSN